MKKIKIISDFILGDIRGVGGAEYNDHVIFNLLKERDVDVELIRSREISINYLSRLEKDARLIISNFTFLNDDSKDYIRNNFSYCVWEHDHKYLKNRNPGLFFNFKAPESYIKNKDFYSDAKFIFCQSDFHKKIIEKNLKLNNLINLSGNFWTKDDLKYIEDLSDKNKDKEKIFSVLDSRLQSKNTKGAIEYCQNNNLEYQLISDDTYHGFLEKLSKNHKFVFLPTTPESLSRVCVEAKMLGVKVVTNSLVGCKYEDWFKKDRKEIVEYLKAFKKEKIHFLISEL